MKKLIVISSLLFAIGCSSDFSEITGSAQSAIDVAPTGKGIVVESHSKTTGGSGTGIYYHGGPIILGTVNVYLIWYGSWLNNTATAILSDLITNISNSPYFNINTTYYNSSNNFVSGAVSLAGSTTDNYSFGTSLTDSDIQSIVMNSISSGSVPSDPNAVYFVLTSADVNETSGFCTSYCGWHNVSVSNIKYAFVGNPDRCPSACEAQTSSPNGNAGADGMASVISHELEESTTDPNLNAWYDHRGQENADKCAWKFGTTYVVSNGSKANMKLGTRDFLIQENWINSGSGGCALHL